MDKERFDDVKNTTFTDEIPDYERPEEDKMIEKLNKIESVDIIVEDEIDHGYTVVGKLSDSEFDKVKEIKDEHPQFHSWCNIYEWGTIYQGRKRV